MRLVIVGVGAIGGTLGARLVQTGREVVFVARGAHGAAIRERGLKLEAPDGSIDVRAETVERVADVAWRADDVVLLCVKTQQAAGAIHELAAVTRAPIACLTNGLEAERIALRCFADVHGVCVYTPASYLEPGVVLQWSAPVRGLLDIGRFPGGSNEIDVALAKAFADAQFASEVRDDIMAHKRTKLLNNLSNGLDAMLGDRESALSDAAMQEARRVYEAAGLATVPSVETDPRRKQMARGEIRGMKRTGGSTWQSVARGEKEIETDYLNGEIALLGRLHGVATPVNERLQRLAAKFVREGRAPGSLTLAELESWDA